MFDGDHYILTNMPYHKVATEQHVVFLGDVVLLFN
jgi:hypothetical protein